MRTMRQLSGLQNLSKPSRSHDIDVRGHLSEKAAEEGISIAHIAKDHQHASVLTDTLASKSLRDHERHDIGAIEELVFFLG